jgi:hypothetical protein
VRSREKTNWPREIASYASDDIDLIGREQAKRIDRPTSVLIVGAVTATDIGAPTDRALPRTPPAAALYAAIEGRSGGAVRW